jgi:predicted Zn-dependent protease
MIRTPFMLRALLPITAALLLAPNSLFGEVPPHLVLLNGKAIPLASVAMQGDNFVVKTAAADLAVGALIPAATVDHVFGDKPVAINQAVALILTGNPDAASTLLEPILAQHKDTAKLPGNFWMEAARTALVAKAATGAGTATTDLVKAISDATPAQGIDPISLLSKALTLPISTKISERVEALRVVMNDEMPADLCAYASFFKAELLKKDKRQDEALEAYLSVSSLYPSGGMVINGVAQFKAAEILTAKNRREEALALVNSSLRCVKGTAAEEPVNQLLQSIK